MKQRPRAHVRISIADQTLIVDTPDGKSRSFPISSSAYGVGFKEGSMKTPTGRFRIAEKIGAGAPLDTVFKGRKPVPASEQHSPDADLIMSRILWLDGLGKRNANTRARYIYIHGTNHEAQIGRPASHGCVRVKKSDVVTLFDLVEVDTPVTITRATARRRRGE